MKKEELFAPIREKYAALKAALNGTDTVYGSRRMGDENIGRRRCDYRFSLCLVIGILGKADERRYDINPMTDHHMMHLPPCLNHLPILESEHN